MAVVIAVAGCGSRTLPTQNPLDDIWTPSEEDVYPAALDVRIEPVEEFGGHRYAHEVAGLVVALYETGLTDLAGVVPHYDRHGPPPGVDRWLTGSSKHWSARFSFGYERDTMQIVLRLCEVGGACKGASASGPRESPEGAITELLVWSAGQMAAPVPAGMVEAWSQPLSADRYAVLVLGRAAASWYGILDPVDPEERGNPDKDPLTRVVLIDPSLSMAHYILARRSLDIGRYDVAARSFDRARKSTPDRFVFEVATAAATAAAGQWAEARKHWDDLDARWPADSRFVIPRLEAYLASDMGKEAKTLVDELPKRFENDPATARIRVEIAEKLGPGPDYEKLVAAWEAAAEYDPEPVRRHIALRLRDGRLEEAFELLEKLEARGAATEAKQMMIALGAEIGRFEDAAKQASIMGSDALAERLRLRAALEKNPRDIPPGLTRISDHDARLLTAKLRLLKQPEQALADVRAVLRENRFHAEGIALEVKVLEKLGRWDEAVQARERLQFADPAFVAGPRTVAGERADFALGSTKAAPEGLPPAGLAGTALTGAGLADAGLPAAGLAGEGLAADAGLTGEALGGSAAPALAPGSGLGTGAAVSVAPATGAASTGSGPSTAAGDTPSGSQSQDSESE
jgi:tetratricopeptide (TPR) repeat protein